VPADRATLWKPNVTVAAVIERDGQFLLVEEDTARGRLYNQPAGHLDPGESLATAVVRETLEETAHHFEPTRLLGVYQYHSVAEDTTYIRFAYLGRIAGHEPERALDAGIVRALWLAPQAIRREAARHRSPLVMRCIDDCLAGRSFPVDAVQRVD